ncbi:MAG: hypothetical protein O6952_03955, partial [Planctomycetota bacterium]|nr:hypothetical protein [Planctomycetota bacterium]
SNAWTAIRQRVIDVSAKIDDTWSEKVEEALEDAGIEGKALWRQEKKGSDLEDSIELEMQKTEVKVFADAARKIFDEARNILAKDFLCTQCKAKLEVPEQFFRSVHVTCQYCTTVNTFEPGGKVRAVEHFCTHHLCSETAWDEYVAMFEAEKVVRDAHRRLDEMSDDEREALEEAAEESGGPEPGDSTLAELKVQETATRAYWTSYLKKHVEIIPEYEENFERELAARLKPFYETMADHDVWQANADN